MVDEFGELHASGIHIVGRIVLNLWRQMQASFAFASCLSRARLASIQRDSVLLSTHHARCSSPGMRPTTCTQLCSSLRPDTALTVHILAGPTMQ